MRQLRSRRRAAGHAVQLALGLLVAAAIGGATLGGFGVDAVHEGLAAVSLAAHGLRGLPGQVVPNPCGLLAPEPIFAVAHVAVGQLLHERPRLEKARLRVLHGPEAGPQVADDLECAKHQPVAGRQIPRPPAEGARVFRAHRAGPHHVEASQRALVRKSGCIEGLVFISGSRKTYVLGANKYEVELAAWSGISFQTICFVWSQ